MLHFPPPPLPPEPSAAHHETVPHPAASPRAGSGGSDLLQRSSVYREFQAELAEILRHKWLESEKAGYDIGFERALLDWVRHHRAAWRAARRSVGSASGNN
ncbi:MAG: DUF4032 domain-containing protein [Verrucomicrobia bacterium]|nr:MAG: DUF4032 domain-containing protein [Verrucomicrobiota bacterium]